MIQSLSFPVAALALAALALAGCKDQAASTQPPPSAPALAPAAPPAAPPAPAAPAVEPPAAPPAAPAASAATPRKLPLGVQGVAPAGVTVRVKGIELGSDATVLDVSISFANRITDSTMLALADTFLEDEGGARLHIKRPDGNRDITIREGQTLDGQLVFLGSVPVTARKLRLVFNDGNDGDNIVAPGLVMELPLQAGG
ncbi:DUF4352 domain-containing protein [Pulveribacter suum]|uniref:DUF4352 domain-containing protein n=1 Tax=Pulveribacter suum TaxID=2116657 RepID=A0A2P1NJH7_9BURK|nr:hypothetical protein [Pulveribacter suum]AVP57197.1 hypothetical protein C7H73_05635 [Pulveribacter suum]